MRLAPKLFLLPVLALPACGRPTATREQLLDPQFCAECHPNQYEEWAGSMHAYAAEDPVFRAMNQRGQRETGGQLGDFCVNCHAPMAAREEATKNGLNLDQVPKELHGVTCYFCHTVEAVEGTHNNPIKLAEDGVLRGSFSDPFKAGRTHEAGYSALLDRDRSESSDMCGACHDLVTPLGSKIERTFVEWKESVFSGPRGATCSQCHMPQSPTVRPVANVPGAPKRRAHSHAFPAVDIALTEFPDRERQRALVQELLDSTLQTAVCVQPFAGRARVSVVVDNVAAGHFFPSGSAQDRRLWMELVAYSGSDVLYSSGVVPDGVPVTSVNDPDLWLMRDCIFAPDGHERHMFWEAASFEGNALPAKVTFVESDPRFYQTHKVRSFPASGAAIPMPDRVTLRVRLRPIGLEVLDSLISTGDLAPHIRDTIPTFDLGATVEWTEASAIHRYLDRATRNTVFCATNSNINVQADKFPAPTRSRCAP